MATVLRLLFPTGALAALMIFAGPALGAGPHGGYNAGTDYCLQCHAVHGPDGDYALMREETVLQVCATCHTIYQVAPSGAYDPGFSGGESPGDVEATTSLKAPYNVAGPGEAAGEHQIGADSIPDSTKRLIVSKRWGYGGEDASAFSATSGGLYCGSCHTPHGNYGQDAYLGLLVSRYPNHDETAEVTGFNETWCGVCHDSNVASEGSHDTHPGSCMDCHGNVSGGSDFPHTGEASLLKSEPDGLCVTCHVAGELD